jgi:hypothetical protein
MDVQVEYLFSRNKKVGSKLISFFSNLVLKEKPRSIKNLKVPSHVCVLVNKRWVHESTLETGVRVISFERWLENNELLYRVGSNYKTVNYGTVKLILKRLRGKPYDYPGVLYFSFRVFLYLLLGVPIPKKNAWHSRNRYFCCELVGKLTGEDYEMTTPVQMLKNFLDINRLRSNLNLR